MPCLQNVPSNKPLRKTSDDAALYSVQPKREDFSLELPQLGLQNTTNKHIIFFLLGICLPKS